jgi:hypothetical protein
VITVISRQPHSIDVKDRPDCPASITDDEARQEQLNDHAIHLQKTASSSVKLSIPYPPSSKLTAHLAPFTQLPTPKAPGVPTKLQATAKMVSLRSLVAGAALIAAPVMAALTPTQLTTSLDSLKQLALDLQGPASQITIINAPLIIIGQGPFPVCLSLACSSAEDRPANVV